MRTYVLFNFKYIINYRLYICQQSVVLILTMNFRKLIHIKRLSSNYPVFISAYSVIGIMLTLVVIMGIEHFYGTIFDYTLPYYAFIHVPVAHPPAKIIPIPNTNDPNIVPTNGNVAASNLNTPNPTSVNNPML